MTETSTLEDGFLENLYHKSFPNCILDGLKVLVQNRYRIAIYPGVARVQGQFYRNNEIMIIKLPEPPHGTRRIDRVILKIDSENQKIRIRVSHGVDAERIPDFHENGKILFIATVRISVDGTIKIFN